MKTLWRLALGFALSLAVVVGVALALAFSPEPEIEEPRDVFGFAALAGREPPPDLEPLRYYRARDGARLAYRIYEAPSDRLLVFVHGSSYHGAYLHALAKRVSGDGLARVALPNLRGHYRSGPDRGDVSYIGQLEDDVADLIAELRPEGRVFLGGHSSGGGFAVRFAGGAHAALVSGYALFSPTLPLAPTLRGGDAGGWAVLHGRRLAGLIALGTLGIHAFDGLPILRFNKPEEFRDGTETLSYSYRLNQSYHPRYDWAADLAATGDRVLVVIGADDEANDAAAFEPLLAEHNPSARLVVLPGVNHFAVTSAPAALDVLADWLR